ncbi:MAG TPA: malto-oligosyltrehalose synthase [Candidatus Angelobacter sp.]|nr:malto-oligosyltrehalose synthase [Candidatus Angelobacter sp.]
MKRIPSATYRLQFNRGFTFREARGILEYLEELGISDIYASPLFEAGPQSTHGYDTCCFGKTNPNLGSTEEFDGLAGDLKARGMGLLLDVVPNHMSATLSNPWWLDVLRNGRESKYAPFFDVDWQPENPALRNKILLPVLEGHYGKVLESGKLRLTFQDGNFFIAYYDRNFPVNAASLDKLSGSEPQQILEELNGKPDDARSFAQLDALIQRQHYRLAYWRVASEEINYRRFFDVTEMVALKMELPEVFRETHRLIFEWLNAGKITGLRIDHPDGLWNPKEYLERLQKEGPRYILVEKILSGNEPLPADWPVDGTTGYDFLNRMNGLFVDGANADALEAFYREFTGCNTTFEQIVYESRKQVLERSFASELNSLTHRLATVAAKTPSGRDFTFTELRRATVEIIASFPVYRTYITNAVDKVSEQDQEVIRTAMKEARKRNERDVEAMQFIERILLCERAGELAESAVKAAREFVMKFQQLTGPAMAKGLEDTAFYRFNRLISLNEVGGDPGHFGVSLTEFHDANSIIAKNWPHTLLASATHDTKRGEDVRARLNILSEMPAEWREAVKRWAALNRGKKTMAGDAPDANDEWLLYQTLVGAWPENGERPNERKNFRERITAFMLKAAKEAKIRTSWTEPNPAYEKALRDFIERALGDGDNVFLADVARFAKRVAFFGRFNSLAQTLLKMTSPGVPDFYQGGELWDLNLVDPDNRRPVDYVARKKMLSELKKSFESLSSDGAGFLTALLRDENAGAMKLFLIWRALNFRRTHRELFDSGDYVPLAAMGERREHVCAFTREWQGQMIVIVVPRLVFGLTEGVEIPPLCGRPWKGTALPAPRAQPGNLFHNILTEEMVPVVDVGGNAALELRKALRSFPVALLKKV